MESLSVMHHQFTPSSDIILAHMNQQFTNLPQDATQRSLHYTDQHQIAILLTRLLQLFLPRKQEWMDQIYLPLSNSKKNVTSR